MFMKRNKCTKQLNINTDYKNYNGRKLYSTEILSVNYDDKISMRDMPPQKVE